MKTRMRKVFSLVLGAVLLLSALPVVMASENHVLYNWAATTVEKDKKSLAVNTVSTAEQKARWNETATIYTEQGKEQIALHTVLNEALGMGNKSYGLPRDEKGTAESLRVDAFPIVRTAGYKAVGLSFIYAYKPSGKGTNLANSDLLQVYVSDDGMNWSESSVGMRSAQMLGSGTTNKGEQIVCYRIYSEDLLKIAGDTLWGVRIVPEGSGGLGKGTFDISEITITGYKSKADFEAAAPTEAANDAGGTVDPEFCRQVIMDAARTSQASNDLGVLADALSPLSVSVPVTVGGMLNNPAFTVLDGIQTAAADSVKALFGYMYERHEMTPEREKQILSEYEAINTSDDIVRDLNTPQTIMRAYGKVKAGDILLQANSAGGHVYLVVKTEPAYLVDRLTVEPYESYVTYLTPKGEKRMSFYEAYRIEGFLPMQVDALAKGAVPLPELDVQLAAADKVQLTLVSNQTLRSCTVTLGDVEFTKDNINEKALFWSESALSDAVNGLKDGEHKLTAVVTDYLGNKATKVIALAVKDGKVTVKGVEAPDHADICPAKDMKDVNKNAWYHDAVDYVLTNGIMGGYDAASFGPDDTLSRAMVAQVLYNKEGQPAVSGKHGFTDVPSDQWYNNAVTWATQKGIMGGYGDGKFGPDDKVTIEQIAVILWNYSGKPAFTGTADSVGKYSDWAANALAWAAENDILKAVPFKNATEDATRAQTAQLLMNYLKNI